LSFELFQDSDSYDKLISVLMRDKAFSDGFPRRVMCDFERGITSTVSKFLPWAEVKKK
jgi:hypothetical protein